MKAIMTFERHLERNGMTGRVDVACKDVQAYVEETIQAGRQYDLVITDPPNFAFTAKDRDGGRRAYRKLNALVLKLVRPGRFLATACCSGQFSLEEFLRILGLAARDAGVCLATLHVRGQGPDHPSPPAFEQGRYLKFVIVEVRRG